MSEAFINALVWFALACGVFWFVCVIWQMKGWSYYEQQLYSAEAGKHLRRSGIVIVVSILWLIFG